MASDLYGEGPYIIQFEKNPDVTMGYSFQLAARVFYIHHSTDIIAHIMIN